ncbi:MAG: hypothetical protein KFB93_03680 [Simkaniaceae bacterium]|nr:MAG: hypothetical protein KFB93_03680 [Simkaniaceae bacterium]
MTHLFLGEEFCKMHRIEDEVNKRDFLVGTLFPDIRYITHFPRERTHFIVKSLKEVEESSSYFAMGMKFHAWVDTVREDFVVASGIYEKVAPYANGRKATLLKFIEEEIIDYDGRKWRVFFGESLDEEKAYASEEQIQKWHTIVWGAMQARPSWPLWGLSYVKSQAFGISNETLYQWSYDLPKLGRDPMLQGYVHDLLDHMLQEMEQQSFLLKKINS